MNPAIDNAERGIASSKRGLKNLLQKIFKRSRKNQLEDSSVCTSTLPDNTCSSNETMAYTRSTEKDESLENSRNITYIEKPKKNNVVHEEYFNIRVWHEVPEQWEIIDEDIPEMGTEALEYDPEKPTANEDELDVNPEAHDINEKEIVVNPDSHNINEQEIEVNPECYDVNEPTIYVNRESREDNDCSAGLKKSSSVGKQEVCQAFSPQECSVTSEPWEYRYEKYMLERAVVPRRRGENESSADFKSSSWPVKQKAARYLHPFKYHSILRKWKYQSKIRRIFSLETLEEELEKPTGNEVDRVNPNNIGNSKSLTVVSDPQKCSATLEERGSQIENITNMCLWKMEKEPEELTYNKKPDNPEENDSSPVFETASCVKDRESSGAVALQKCSATLETIINTCTDLQEIESEKPKNTEKEIAVNQESVENKPVFEKAGCMKRQKSSEAASPQDCYVTLEKWETQYDNIKNANSGTPQTEPEEEEEDNDKKTVFNLDSLEENESLLTFENADCGNECKASGATAPQKCYAALASTNNDMEKFVNPDSLEESKSLPVLENVGCMRKFGVSETVALQRCSTTLARTAQYNDIRYIYLETFEMESEKSTGNEEEILMNPHNMEEDEYFFCPENAGSKKAKIYSEDVVADSYFVNVKKMKAEYENIINAFSETLKHDSKRAKGTDKKKVMNPDSLEESVSLYGASEAVAPWKYSATLKKRYSQYENSASLCSEKMANEWKESINNEKERNIHSENLEENESSPVLTGCEKKWGASENIILNTYSEIVEMESVKLTDNEQERVVNPDKLEENESSLFLETCKYQHINRGSETLKKDSKEPTAENEEKGLEEIDHLNDRKNVSFRIERDASRSSIRREGFLMLQILFVPLYLMAVLFILWVQKQNVSNINN